MTAITVILAFVAAGTWAWIIGDHFDWWRRAAARRRYQHHNGR